MKNSFFKTAAYNLLDRLTHKRGIARRINNMTIRFPARWSRYFSNNYEADNYRLLEQQVKKGMHILDIGAHIGLFSVRASQLTGPSGKIISLEPTPGTFSILKETLRLNDCKNVIPVQAAMSDREGSATFYISKKDEGCNDNSLFNNKPVKDILTSEVRLYSIDGIVAEYSLQPSLIKIDVEGAELDVLKGGAATFANYRPVLILGLHPGFIKQKGDSLEAIWDKLLQSRYEMQMDGKVLTRPDFCSHTLLFDVHCFPV